MELGNILFGNSRGDYPFPDRHLVNCKEWERLREVCQCDAYGFTSDEKHKTQFGGFENEVFIINPYTYKPTGFTIDWYKYPFRDSYMNKDLSRKELKEIWKDCIKLVKGAEL